MLILFLLAFNYLFAQNNIDSLISLLPTLNDDTAKVNLLIEIANSGIGIRNDVNVYSQMALDLSEKLKYKEGKVMALIILGRNNHYQGNYSEAIRYFIDVEKLIEENKSIDKKYLIHNYLSLGETFRALEDYNTALDYLKKAEEISLSLNNKKALANIINRQAAIYFELFVKKIDTSYGKFIPEYVNNSLVLLDSLKDNNLIINNYNILGSYYAEIKEFQNALKYYNYSLKFIKDYPEYPDRPNVLNNISAVYLFLKDYDNSLKYAYESYNISLAKGIKIYTLESAHLLYQNYEKLKDYESAFKYSLVYCNIYNELYGVKNFSNIATLKYKYEMEKQKQEERERKNKYMIIAISGMIIIIFVAASISYTFRKEKKNYKILAENNEIIKKQKAQLEEANVTKDKFLSILSHDLRNPFNAILGFSEILKTEYDSLTDTEKREYIEYINHSANNVFKLIDKVLQWSRLQDGRFDFTPEKVSIKEVINNVIELFIYNANRKEINLTTDIKDDFYIFVNKNIIEIILRNLVDNAIKFTNQNGNVLITYEIKNNFADISVIDDGIGMTQEEINNIFKIDKKIKKTGTKSEEGTGLGLIICKEMIEKSGGELKIFSNEGKGSKFVLSIPIYKNEL